MAFVIFPFLLNSFHENDQYVESIQFIKNKNIKRNPQETYIIADDYSYIGYPLWNRALRYEWAVKNNNFEELIQNKKLSVFCPK